MGFLRDVGTGMRFQKSLTGPQEQSRSSHSDLNRTSERLSYLSRPRRFTPLVSDLRRDGTGTGEIKNQTTVGKTCPSPLPPFFSPSPGFRVLRGWVSGKFRLLNTKCFCNYFCVCLGVTGLFTLSLSSVTQFFPSF